MLALRGIYQNGRVEFEKKVESTEKMEVIVTFLQESKLVDKRTELLELLKNGPVMSDEEYEQYLEGRKLWNRGE